MSPCESTTVRSHAELANRRGEKKRGGKKRGRKACEAGPEATGFYRSTQVWPTASGDEAEEEVPKQARQDQQGSNQERRARST